MIAPIYIPSKGRAGQAKAVDLFHLANLPVTLFVEKQDYADYREAYPWTKIVVIPKSDQGMAYVRNVMVAYAAARDIRWTWQVDDDIDNMHRKHPLKARMIRLSHHEIEEYMEAAEEVIKAIPKVAFAGLEWRNNAWSATKPVKYNTKAGLFTMQDNLILEDFRWRGVLRSDVDMSLQLLAAGYQVVKLTRLAFSAPGCGENPVGGLVKQYGNKKVELAAVKDFIKRWEPWASMRISKAGRPATKINWRRFIKDHAKA